MRRPASCRCNGTATWTGSRSAMQVMHEHSHVLRPTRTKGDPCRHPDHTRQNGPHLQPAGRKTTLHVRWNRTATCTPASRKRALFHSGIDRTVRRARMSVCGLWNGTVMEPASSTDACTNRMRNTMHHLMADCRDDGLLCGGMKRKGRILRRLPDAGRESDGQRGFSQTEPSYVYNTYPHFKYPEYLNLPILPLHKERSTPIRTLKPRRTPLPADTGRLPEQSARRCPPGG